MKKTLLFFAVVAMGISLITAQSVKNVASNKGKATHAKVAEMQVSKSTNVTKAVNQQKTYVLRNKIALKGNNAHSKRMAMHNKLAHSKRIGNFKSRTPLLKMKASKDTTFYEGFESYNGTTLNWIPSNWTELVKNSTTYVTGDSINPTWSVNPENSYAFPSVGNSMAWVDWDGVGDVARAQDVWLVSPALTPISGDYINFDFFYDPYWMYIDYNNSTSTSDAFNFTKANATMQMHVSVDNGTTWTKVWDAIDDAGQFNESNIYDAYPSWNTIQKSLEAYAGKTIKIAFRYVGKDGDSMGLDDISVRQLLPAALYVRPQGYFYLGLSPDYYKTSANLMLGHAYQSATWYNYSNQDSKSFTWTFDDPSNSSATITSTEVHPEVLYPYGEFKVPSLKATAGTRDSIYTWGTSSSGAYFIAGGSADLGTRTFGVGNYDLISEYINYIFAPNDYCFGTGPDNSVDAIANYFDKPAHRYLLDSIWINLGQFAAPAGTEFKLTLRRVVDGYLADTIATSVCTTERVLQPMTGYFTMPFKGFTTIDPSTGLDVTNDYLEISDAIFVELSGFNVPNVTLSAFSQITDTSYGESNAYVYYNQKDTTGANVRTLLGGSDYIGATSLLFNLGVTYSYIATPDTSFVAPIAGGNKTFTVDSWYSPDAWWLDASLPEWLTSEQTFNSSPWAITYTLKATALPAGVTGRGTVVKVITYGAEMNLKVTQGDYTGLSTATATNTQVINKGNSFDISYTSDFKSVAIHNAAGQLISKYELPVGGRLTIPANNMNKGIYLFSFNGKNAETKKVIR